MILPRLIRSVVVAVVAMTWLLVEVAADVAKDDLVTTPSGLRYKITHRGTGPAPQPGNVVIAHYVGTLLDGTPFDSSRDRAQPFDFTLSRAAGPDGKGEIKRQVIAGWDEGFRLLRVGDRATFVIPPQLAYGERQLEKIPANSTLKFEVEFVGLKERALADWLRERLDSGPIEQAIAEAKSLHAGGSADLHVSEAQLNGLGYRYLVRKPTDPAQTKDPSDVVKALAVFELNAALYPASANVHDSLGEALLKVGRKDEALAAYRRSLELDPKNENAAKVLKENSEQPTK